MAAALRRQPATTRGPNSSPAVPSRDMSDRRHGATIATHGQIVGPNQHPDQLASHADPSPATPSPEVHLAQANTLNTSPRSTQPIDERDKAWSSLARSG